jgi:hypothetical protein
MVGPRCARSLRRRFAFDRVDDAGSIATTGLARVVLPSASTKADHVATADLRPRLAYADV